MLVKINQKSEIPLIGVLPFGIIDRGTNLLQIRPTSVCNLKCPFCSTNANNLDFHPNNYIVDPNYLIAWAKEIFSFKEITDGEANLDSVGEILTHPDLVKIAKEISEIKQVKTISMQTNGCLLTNQKVKQLEPYLTRINLSINAFTEKKAKYLSGSKSYNLNNILETAKAISKSKIELLLAPVWIPNVNDEDILKIIKLAKQLNAKLGVQKYETYQYSRKLKEAKQINFFKFFKQLEKWEREYNIKLKLRKEDFSIHLAKRYPITMKKGEKLQAIIKAPGWQKDQMIAVAKNRAITINNCNKEINDLVNIQILQEKNNIYTANLL